MLQAGKSGKASTEHLRRRQGSDWTANWLAINGDHFLIEHTSEGMDGEVIWVYLRQVPSNPLKWVKEKGSNILKFMILNWNLKSR